MTISVNDSRLRFKLVVVVVVVVDVLVGSSVSVVSNVEVAAVELSMSFEKKRVKSILVKSIRDQLNCTTEFPGITD